MIAHICRKIDYGNRLSSNVSLVWWPGHSHRHDLVRIHVLICSTMVMRSVIRRRVQFQHEQYSRPTFHCTVLQITLCSSIRTGYIYTVEHYISTVYCDSSEENGRREHDDVGVRCKNIYFWNDIASWRFSAFVTRCFEKGCKLPVRQYDRRWLFWYTCCHVYMFCGKHWVRKDFCRQKAEKLRREIWVVCCHYEYYTISSQLLSL